MTGKFLVCKMGVHATSQLAKMFNQQPHFVHIFAINIPSATAAKNCVQIHWPVY